MRVIREYFSYAISVALIMVIPACSKQSQNIKKAASSQQQAAFLLDDTLETNIDVSGSEASHLHLEAKLTDIPTMVGSVISDDGQSYELAPDQCMLSWASPYDLETINNFYLQEMERFGWQQIAIVTGRESLLVFQKPKKICVISIRPLKAKSKDAYTHLVQLTISSKENNE